MLVATLDLARGKEAPRRLRLLPRSAARPLRATGRGHLKPAPSAKDLLSCGKHHYEAEEAIAVDRRMP